MHPEGELMALETRYYDTVGILPKFFSPKFTFKSFYFNKYRNMRCYYDFNYIRLYRLL